MWLDTGILSETNYCYTVLMKKYLHFVFVVMAAALFWSCHKETGLQPVVRILSVPEIASDGTSGSISYSVENPAEGKSVTPSCEEPWISSFKEEEAGIITFTVTENESGEARTALVTLSYPGAQDVVAEVVQSGKEGLQPGAAFDIAVRNVTSFTAEVTVTPADDEMTYLLLTRSRSEFEAAGDDGAVIASDLELFSSYAEKQGVSLELFLEAVLLRKGITEGVMDTFLPDSEYYIYVYGIDKNGTVTTDIYKECVKTEPLAEYDDKISIEAESVTSRSIMAVFTPESEKFRYYAGYMTEAEYENYGDEVSSMIIEELALILQMNNALGNPMTWNDLTVSGAGILPAQSLYSGTGYSFFAFGIDNGYKNTGLFEKVISTPEVDVTDGCTFDVSYSDINSSGATVRIEPASSQTRYFMTYVESASLAGLSVGQIADACMNAAEEAGINWASSNLIHTGTYTEEFTGLIPSNQYSVIVFGVNAEGDRTTDVSLTTFTTADVQASDMTLDIIVGEVTYNSAEITVRPSSETEEYVLTIIPAEDFEAYGGDARAVRDEICANQSKYCKEVLTGTNTIYAGYVWDYGYISPGKEYVVIAFGASYWHPTTEAFAKAFATPERDVSDATADIKVTVYDGNDLVASDPDTYPEAKWKDRAAILIEFIPNSSTASWYGWLETRSSEYMHGLNYDVLLLAIKKYGQFFNNSKPGNALVSAPWNYQNYCAVSLAVDAEGKDGAPVIESLCVDRSQIVPLNAMSLKNAVQVSPVDRIVEDDMHAPFKHEEFRQEHNRHVLPAHIIEAVRNAGDDAPEIRTVEEIVADNVIRTAEAAGAVTPYRNGK